MPQLDVIIIGGSYAGLSAAMSLGRSLRNVLVIDGGNPCNAPTPHSHNFLTHDGNTPSEISRLAREQVSNYKTVSFLDDVAVAGSRGGSGFQITVGSGRTFESKKLIVATGIKDQLPDIKGVKECWGKSVIHCPYCHGYEFHGQKTAILADGENAMHYALLVGNLTKNLVVLSNGKSELTEDQRSKLSKHHIDLIETEVTEIVHAGGNVKSVILKDNSTIPFDAIYFRPPFVQHSDIPASLGCEFTELGHIKVDAMQNTTVKGVYACGDNCSPMRAVANAVSTGNFAGAVVNKDLAGELF